MRNYVIGGNWKLKINTIDETKRALIDIRNFVESTDTGTVKIFLALPYPTLYLGAELLADSSIALAAQNIHYEETGAFTGEVSIQSVKEFDVEYILVGHSERRLIFNEPDKVLNKKIHTVLDHGITPVFCIGETAAQRNSGEYQEVLDQQLSSGLENVTADQMKQIIIAYEPVWAINNPLLNPGAEIKAATPEEAEAAHAYIRSWLVDHYGEAIAQTIPIQYGGSMKPANCDKLLPLADIDGGLIGSASLSSETFGPIIKTATSI